MGDFKYDQPYYWVRTDTNITLEAVDYEEPCVSGVKKIHYEIWWDQDENEIVDTQVANVTVYDNVPNDLDPTIGNISVELNFTEQYFHEIRWYSVDNAGNVENVTIQTHYVDDTAPQINHTAVIKTKEGDEIEIKATITDNLEVLSAKLFWRKKGETEHVRTVFLQQIVSSMDVGPIQTDLLRRSVEAAVSGVVGLVVPVSPLKRDLRLGKPEQARRISVGRRCVIGEAGKGVAHGQAAGSRHGEVPLNPRVDLVIGLGGSAGA